MRTAEDIQLDILFAERELASAKQEVEAKQKHLEIANKAWQQVYAKLKSLLIEQSDKTPNC
jgi:hypothetical protein